MFSEASSEKSKASSDAVEKVWIKTIRNAVRSGINVLDTSPWYGESERIVGEAISKLPRRSFYLHTKTGRYAKGEKTFDFSREATIKSVLNSIEVMGCEYIDLIQVHDPEFCVPDLSIGEPLGVYFRFRIKIFQWLRQVRSKKYTDATPFAFFSARGNLARARRITRKRFGSRDRSDRVSSRCAEGNHRKIKSKNHNVPRLRPSEFARHVSTVF